MTSLDIWCHAHPCAGGWYRALCNRMTSLDIWCHAQWCTGWYRALCNRMTSLDIWGHAQWCAGWLAVSYNCEECEQMQLTVPYGTIKGRGMMVHSQRHTDLLLYLHNKALTVPLLLLIFYWYDQLLWYYCIRYDTLPVSAVAIMLTLASHVLCGN